MPLYEYECDACQHRFEVIQKYSDPLVKVCPKCGGEVQKLLSSPAIQFKGSGWYITDYARSGSPDSSGKADKADKADKTEKPDASASGDRTPAGEKTTPASSESKPAASPSAPAPKSE